jgi:hypothetical protein
MTYETDEPKTKRATKDFSPSDGIVDKHSLCDLTQRPTTENTHNIQEGEYTQPLELVNSGRKDTQKDSDEMETGDEFDGRPSDTSQCSDIKPPTRGDLRKGDYTHYTQSASAYRLKKTPTLPDRKPQISPLL